MSLSVCVVVGTRPDIIKLSEVIKTIDQHTKLTLVHTGQHYDYELNGVFFEELGVKEPDYFLECAGKTAISTISSIFVKTEELFDEIQPDCLLLYGDCNSSLCVYVAKRKHIPIFHMEAGNRCFDARVPEEVNRKIIDHLSDVNMTISEHARRYLLNEGCDPNFVFKVGSCMKDVLNVHRERIGNSNVLSRLSLDKEGYYLVCMHREENIDNSENLNSFSELLLCLSEKATVVVSTHPKTRAKLKTTANFEEISKREDRILLAKPFGFFDYMNLQKNALCVVSDSGTIFEESSIFSFPAISIRNSFERPEGMDSGVLSVVHWDIDLITAAIDCAIVLKNKRPVEDYEVENVGAKVLNIIFSMINQVNSKIYFK